MTYEKFLRAGKYMVPVEVGTTHKRIFFKFSFNEILKNEIKSMQGCQYHGFANAPNRDLALSLFGSDKIWSVSDTTRNRFQIAFLEGKNPYDPFDQPIVEHQYERPLRQHQRDLANHILTTRRGIWAAEMGTGKTLAAIEVMERVGRDWWYVAPKSALRSVEREFRLWVCTNIPTLMTYNELVKRMKNWDDAPAPYGVVFDESHKIKTPTAQRSEAALALADGIREDHDGVVLLMTGTPAPKAPTDWWFQCEIACPGFLKEGTINKFKMRLGLHEQRESQAGGVFAERLTWLDDERKCRHCGEFADSQNHMLGECTYGSSTNEVELLYKRMKGLVVVKFKKDCTDLPEKQYRIIEAPPLPSTIRAAKTLAKTSGSAAKALILLRELSDGFQYTETEDGAKECPACSGSCQIDDFEIKPEFREVFEQTGLPPYTDEDSRLSADAYQKKYYQLRRIDCPTCAGRGEVTRYKRTVQRVPCPKDDVLRDILDEHSDVGRLVVYAGFEGSVNRAVEVALSEKWAVVKWDGKGIKVFHPNGSTYRTVTDPADHNGLDTVEPLTVFQDDFDNFPRVCFVGNADAAGTGLTLTASPSILYYSNSFSADSRIQSEDRIHRIGMDSNRGATIIDIFHLPTDKYVHDNLKKKRKLQDLTMGEISSIFKDDDDDRVF